MNDFFNWWTTSTDGREYMSIWHCSREDLYTVLALVTAASLVLVQYLDVAIFNIKKARKFSAKGSILPKYLLYKCLVFTICGLSGYGYVLLAIFIQSYKLQTLFMLVLAFVTWRFRRYMKTAGYLERIYEQETKLRSRISILENALEAQVLEHFSPEDNSTKKIPIEQLKELSPGVWYPVSDLVRFRKVSQDPGRVVFETELQSGGSFSRHFHNALEICKVLEGELVSPEREESTGPGGRVTYMPGEVHSPYSPIFTRLEVTFLYDGQDILPS